MKELEQFDLTALFKDGKVAVDFGISLKDVVPCNLRGVIFSNGDLSGIGAKELEITDSTFCDIWLVKSGLYDSRFERVIFQDCKIRELDFERCELESVTFKHCDILQMSIIDSCVTNVTFENCLFDNLSSYSSTIKQLHIENCQVALPPGYIRGIEDIDKESLDVLQRYRFQIRE